MRPNLDVKQLNGKGEAGTSGIYNDVDRKFFKKKGYMDFVKGIRPYFYLHSQWNSHFRWVTVEGLSHLDVRHLAEKIGEQPEQQSERDKTAEFSIPTWMVCIEMMAVVVMVKVKVLDYMFFLSQVLNGLEHLGYKVVTSGQYVTGQGRYDQREFVWTLHKSKEDWETSS